MTEGFNQIAVSIFIGLFGLCSAPPQARAANLAAAAPKASEEKGAAPAGETASPNAGPQKAIAPPAARPAGEGPDHAGGPQEANGTAPHTEEDCPCHEHDAAHQTNEGPAAANAVSGQAAAGGECACQGGDGACPYHAGATSTGEPHNGPPQVLVLTLAPGALGTFQATNDWRAGGMLMIATPIVWHELELQVDLAFFGGPAGLASSLDFLVKRPFRIGDAWRPYIGIGPSVSLERLNTEPRDSSTSSFGVTGTGGTYYWFTGECAVMAYAEYTAVFAKPFRNALLLGIGISYAFSSAT